MKILKKVIICAILIIICLGLFLICREKNTPCANNRIFLSDGYEREAYLNLKGWEVTPVGEREIVIPENFNGIYTDFAQIQKNQKLPLEDFKGKVSTQYLYIVENYGGTYPVYAELLISDNQLVATALVEQRPNGFIKEIY